MFKYQAHIVLKVKITTAITVITKFSVDISAGSIADFGGKIKELEYIIQEKVKMINKKAYSTFNYEAEISLEKIK